MLILKNGNYFTLEIPITTKYSKDDYGINIVGFTKTPTEPLTCTLNASGSKINATFSQDINLVYNGWDSAYTDDNGNTSKKISAGTHTYYIKDDYGNTGMCSINVVDIIENKYDKYENVAATSNYKYVVGGNCSCINNTTNEKTLGTCGQNGCACFPVGKTRVLSDSCTLTKEFSHYSCSSGTLVGSQCKVKTGESTIYTCPNGGYKRISGNNSYCYK